MVQIRKGVSVDPDAVKIVRVTEDFTYETQFEVKKRWFSSPFPEPTGRIKKTTGWNVTVGGRDGLLYREDFDNERDAYSVYGSIMQVLNAEAD